MTARPYDPRSFDHLPAIFDRFTELAGGPLADYLSERLPAHGGRAADLGCGTGRHAHLLAPVFDEVLAVDISAPMLQFAQVWVRAGQLTAATAQAIHLYRAEQLHRTPHQPRDPERLPFWMPYPIAVASVPSGAISDAVSAAALLHAEQDRLRGSWQLPQATPPRPPRLFRV